MPEIKQIETLNIESLFIISNHHIFKDRENIASACDKLALFDLDDTLIKFDFSKTAKSNNEFCFLYKNMIEKFQNLDKENYFIAILSNQMYLVDKLHLEKKIEWLMTEINVPILFLSALDRDFYRKPAPGMFDYINKNYFLSKIDQKILEKSFYVGDAAGRKTNKRRDHSDCDLKLAYNIGLNFYTPEEFFDQNYIVEDLVKQKTDYRNYKLNFLEINKYKENNEEFDVIKSDIIFVYGKGRYSGKTFFANKYFSDYKIHRGKAADCPMFNNKKKSIVKYCKNDKEKIRYSKRIIFFDCKDMKFMNKVIQDKKITKDVYFLDFDDVVLRWLKIFSELTDKKSLSSQKPVNYKNYIRLFESYGIRVKNIKFKFDDLKFDDHAKKISKLAL